MTFSIHMANIVFHDKPVESNGEAEEIRNDPTSSPHSRGTRDSQRHDYEERGIIPAFAGNTPAPRRSRVNLRDHPRIRGEHLEHGYEGKPSIGSSPHSRGTPAPKMAPAEPPRIIPAFAGNTPQAAPFSSGPEDHPRIRGEHTSLFKSPSSVLGSSPHSRGTLQ